MRRCFGDEGSALDSVDALELGLAVQKAFGFQMDGEEETCASILPACRLRPVFIRSKQA